MEQPAGLVAGESCFRDHASPLHFLYLFAQNLFEIIEILTVLMFSKHFKSQCVQNVRHSNIFKVEVHRLQATATFSEAMRPER